MTAQFYSCGRLLRVDSVPRCSRARRLTQAQLSKGGPAGAKPPPAASPQLEKLFTAAAGEKLYPGRKGRVPKAVLKTLLLRFAVRAAATSVLERAWAAAARWRSFLLRQTSLG